MPSLGYASQSQVTVNAMAFAGGYLSAASFLGICGLMTPKDNAGLEDINNEYKLSAGQRKTLAGFI
jgi:hypothetical protein